MPEEAAPAYAEPAPRAVVHVSRTFPAERERVFRAWIEPDAVRQWFGLSDLITRDAEADARVGGSYRITLKMPPAMRTVYVVGTFLEIEPPRRLVLTLT